MRHHPACVRIVMWADVKVW